MLVADVRDAGGFVLVVRGVAEGVLAAGGDAGGAHAQAGLPGGAPGDADAHVAVGGGAARQFDDAADDLAAEVTEAGFQAQGAGVPFGADATRQLVRADDAGEFTVPRNYFAAVKGQLVARLTMAQVDAALAGAAGANGGTGAAE